MRILLTAVAVLFLHGCATPKIVADITAFHDQMPATGETIAVLPWKQEKRDSLEFRTYANVIEQQLAVKGFRVTQPESRPTLIAFLDFGIDDGREHTSSYAIPHYGVTGHSSAYTTGRINTFGTGATYSGTTTYTPQYGITGYSTGIRSTTLYTRFVNLDIVRMSGESPRKVYEGRLRSTGQCGSIAPIFPQLAGMMFTEFPGTTGQPRRALADFDPNTCP